jgi:hypothetical protein
MRLSIDVARATYFPRVNHTGCPPKKLGNCLLEVTTVGGLCMNLSPYYFCLFFFRKTAVFSRFAVLCYGCDFGRKSVINMSA